MRNLDLCHVSRKVLQNIKLDPEKALSVCHGHDSDDDCGELYVCTHNLVLANYDYNGQEKWILDLSEDATEDSKPLNMTFLTLRSILCVGLTNGDIYTISNGGSTCELPGLCDHGLVAMEWSPDQELLVLVTKKLNTILMTCTFDAIGEVNLLGDEFGEGKFMTVGWGKKETQFHGSEGKQAAKVKLEVSADPQTISDDFVKITWKGDGSLYAIGFTLDGIKRFKVFNRQGELQFTSEKQQGLEGNLAWRPSGNLIATTQKLPDKYIVSFFEKNGLKHGEFNIPVNSTTVVENLFWSSDSEILTLQCRDTATNTQTLLLYTTSNYHWYLKQTLSFDSGQNICKIMWVDDFDVANNKQLHIILYTGEYLTYTWVWNIDHSRGMGDDDDAVVTVIDGNKLLVTGFRQTVVPPPMAATEIEFDTFITSVHFASSYEDEDIKTNSFFVRTADNKLIFYEQTQKFPLQYKVSKTVEFEKEDYPFQFYNLYWVYSDIIIGVTENHENGYSISEFTVDAEAIQLQNMFLVPDAAIRIHSHPSHHSCVYLQLYTGRIIQYTLGGEIESQNVYFKFPCPRFVAFEIDNYINFVGLCQRGNLFINNKMAISNVSSFYVHSHFLLITTLQHEMMCVEISAAGLSAIKNLSTNDSELVYRRKIERGAKLVIAVSNDTRTVFQMPRGNLETIQPRPLSLKTIGEYLDRLKYHEAFDIMRKQRINLNLIYDHDPEKFEKNIDKFLEIIKNNSWLNLFLSELENIDVTKTMYSSSYVGRNNNVSRNKVQRICDTLREHLKKRSDCDSKILPLLTTHVKKNNAEDLEMALTIIKELKLKESMGSKLLVGSDEALKYLLYMVDVSQLFDVALGMYDFELVLLVATKSQKDPKEYIPMLNDLNEMDENYKSFTINKHLKRFDKAVEWLVKCGPERHNELKTFVKYHSLYREALGLFSKTEDIFKQISDDFGQYLKLKKQFVEAGIIYERSNNYDKAIECYKDGVEWELAINLAQSWPTEQFKELCWDFIDVLREEKRHSEALTILEQFYDDTGEAIVYATECGHYRTALRLSTKYNRLDVKEQLIIAILEDCKNMKDQIDRNQAIFVHHRNRLRVVREKKVANPVAFESYANKDCDLYSDAGSTLASSSRGSSKSYRSSKNRRKHERKVASLKEGSQYEDVALVMALHVLVTSSFDMRPLVKEMVTVLCCSDHNKEAFILQITLDKLLKEMKDSLKEIWTNELLLEATNASIEAMNIPEGSSIIPQGIAMLDPPLRFAPVIQEINWKLEGLF